MTVSLLYPSIVNITHVTARSCKKLIRLAALEYKSQPGCGVCKTLYKTRLIYAKIQYLAQAPISELSAQLMQWDCVTLRDMCVCHAMSY